MKIPNHISFIYSAQDHPKVAKLSKLLEERLGLKIAPPLYINSVWMSTVIAEDVRDADSFELSLQCWGVEYTRTDDPFDGKQFKEFIANQERNQQQCTRIS